MASDIDKFACETYKTNFGIDSYKYVRKLEEKDIPYCDILCAGFPCQSFSVAGFRKGFEYKTRGTLFFEICRILKQKKPKYLLLENVKQLVKHNNGETYNIIINSLKELGYITTKEPLILSPTQFGVPQDRQRVFIPAIHKDYYNKKYIEIDIPQTDIYSILDKKVDKKYNISDYELKTLTAWDEFHKHINNCFGTIWVDEFGKDYDYSHFPSWKQTYCRENRKIYLENKDFIDNWIKKYDVLNFKLRYRIFEWQAGKEYQSVFDTIIQLRQSGIRCKKPTCFQTLVAMVQIPIIGKLKRRLTPRETARLQSFPEKCILRYII